MIDFPIGDLMDEDAWWHWLTDQLHPDGRRCPRCHAQERRVAQHKGFWTAWRCRACDRYDTPLTGALFAKTRQRPSTLVLLVRGVANGVSASRLARELGWGRVRVHELRQQLQQNLRARRPSEPLPDDVLEADELYQNAGEKGAPHRDPEDPPRRRANQRRGHGTDATDRPPVFSALGQAAKPGAQVLNTDEWRRYVPVTRQLDMRHATVKQGRAGSREREWARDGDGLRARPQSTVAKEPEPECGITCGSFAASTSNTWRTTSPPTRR
jgi:transposase-like protein